MRDWLTDELDSMGRRIGFAALLAYCALALALLLAVTLIQLGVLSGWGDLLKDVSPASA